MKRRELFSILSILVLACLSAPASFGQKLEMLKIVVQPIGPVTAENLSDAKKTTIYRAGEKYLRFEEAPDPVKKQSLLIITKEPESWMINVADNTASHLVDTGPTFNARLPILWAPKGQGVPDIDRQLLALEFGNEEVFFRQNNARELGTRTIDGKECKVSAIKSGPWEVTLLMDPETNTPVQIESTRDGKPDLGYHYISYQKELPFEPALFDLPPGLKVTERGPVSPATPSPTPAN